MDTDENKTCIYRCESVPHRWLYGLCVPSWEMILKQQRQEEGEKLQRNTGFQPVPEV